MKKSETQSRYNPFKVGLIQINESSVREFWDRLKNLQDDGETIFPFTPIVVTWDLKPPELYFTPKYVPIRKFKMPRKMKKKWKKARQNISGR